MSDAARSPDGDRWLEGERDVDGIVIASVVALPETRLAEAQALYRLLDPNLPPITREGAETALDASGVTVLAAFTPDERLAGLVTLIVARTLARTRAWAEDLVVHPDFRGRGIGKALMAACIEAAAGAGADTVDGTVAPSRREALALYLATGWEVSRSIPVRRNLTAIPPGSRSAGTHR